MLYLNNLMFKLMAISAKILKKMQKIILTLDYTSFVNSTRAIIREINSCLTQER
jgi:hypothetical protein